jgi:hypothetical protein
MTRWWAESAHFGNIHHMWPLSIIKQVIMSLNINQEEESLYAYLCTTLLDIKCPSNTLGNFSQLFYVYHVEGTLYLWGALLAKRREFTPICRCGIQLVILKKYVCEKNPPLLTTHDLQMGRFSQLFLKNERNLVPRDLTSCLSLCASKMVGNKCDVTINSKS